MSESEKMWSRVAGVSQVKIIIFILCSVVSSNVYSLSVVKKSCEGMQTCSFGMILSTMERIMRMMLLLTIKIWMQSMHSNDAALMLLRLQRVRVEMIQKTMS